MTVTDYAEIVAALRAVPGVADADLEPDDDGGGLGMLRLGLAPGFDEAQVALHVGQLLRDRFGLGVDAERVQLVEDAAILPSPEHESPGRPAIVRMQLVSSGFEVTGLVTLSFRGHTSTGESAGTATPQGVQKAVANATLRAVEGLLGERARFELDHLEVATTGRDRTVLAAVTLLSSGGTERLTGSATVREDVRQACIRATLDAVNRRLELLLG